MARGDGVTQKSLKETYQEFAENLWISKIFRQDFGTSDVITNYSRIYSWMANQLGHMTLGLGVTLLVVWASDTVALAVKPNGTGPWPWVIGWFSFFGLALIAWKLAPPLLALAERMRGWRDSKAVGEEKRLADANFKKSKRWLEASVGIALVGFVLLVADPFGRGILVGCTIALLSLATVLVPYAILRNKDVPWRGRAIGAVITAGIVALVFLFLHLEAIAAKDDEHLPRRLGALFIAPLMLGIALSIAKSGSYAIAGCLAIVIAMFIATDSFFLGPVAAKIVAVLLAAAFAASGANIHVKHPTFRPKQGARVRKWFQANWFCTVGAIVALLFLLLFDMPDWELPLAAAIISMAVWTMKEVGSDLQVVDSELELAEDNRRKNYGIPEAAQQTDPSQHLWKTPERIKEIYYSDAGWDLATDCGFYLAGAVIGAGIVSSTGVIGADEDYAWASGVEIIGLIAFVALFLALGRNWGYRQFAVDRSGASRADRLALNWSQIRLFNRKGGLDVNPLLELHEFARGRGDNAHDMRLCEFKHLFIVGAHAVGKGPLADALVTEAALANAPASPAPFWDTVVPPSSPRSSRMISAQSMIDSYHRGQGAGKNAHNLSSQEIRLNPTHNLYEAERGKVSKTPLQRDATPKFRAASLVCINDYAPSTTPHSDIAKIVAELNLKAGGDQATVWVVSDFYAAEIACKCVDEPSCDAFFVTYIDPIIDSIDACADEPERSSCRDDFAVVLLTRNPSEEL